MTSSPSLSDIFQCVLPLLGTDDFPAYRHPLGFFHISPRKLANIRIHIWPGPSKAPPQSRFPTIHNHLFSFESRVLVGRVLNKRYCLKSCEQGALRRFRIKYKGEVSELTPLEDFASIVSVTEEEIKASHTYSLSAEEYHSSIADEGTVTILRTKHTENANVFVLKERSHNTSLRFTRQKISFEELRQTLLELKLVLR